MLTSFTFKSYVGNIRPGCKNTKLNSTKQSSTVDHHLLQCFRYICGPLNKVQLIKKE